MVVKDLPCDKEVEKLNLFRQKRIKECYMSCHLLIKRCAEEILIGQENKMSVV